jgi:hypothetical protein
LTVPDELGVIARRLAAVLRTTEADAVVRLGLMGAAQYEREERLAELARTRRQSVARHASSAGAERFPSAEEARQAVLDARDDA